MEIFTKFNVGDIVSYATHRTESGFYSCPVRSIHIRILKNNKIVILYKLHSELNYGIFKKEEDLFRSNYDK